MESNGLASEIQVTEAVKERLGEQYQFEERGPITIKGQAYFALTPSCVMAGGQLEAVYRELGEIMFKEFSGWRAAVFTSELALGKATGLRSHKRYALFNGALETHLLLFNLTGNQLKTVVFFTDQKRLQDTLFFNGLAKFRQFIFGKLHAGLIAVGPDQFNFTVKKIFGAFL